MPECPSGAYPYTIQSGDSLWLIANRFHTTIQEIASVNPTLDINKLYIGQMICIPEQPAMMGISKAEQTLSNHMRLLWEQHVYWTRLVILSMAFALPDTEFVTNRLLRNPKDFEAALKPFYGADIAAKFEICLQPTSLLLLSSSKRQRQEIVSLLPTRKNGGMQTRIK